MNNPFRKEDTPLDKARIVARSYREALHMHLPDLCARLDKRMVDLGQPWVKPKVAQYEYDELLNARQAADYCQISPATLQQWKLRGLRVVETVDGRRYRVGDLLDYQAGRRQRRASRSDSDRSTA